ncbi:MAG: hypothetical protein DIZ80_09105 [endosymbiont of Galathealinum brachiosum]|uniref:Serine aminopeptidase S33 domain-containing protein n=1 Tax=endosymbiont of Galathealinum brachiosum TaxID=2200906 RepID=A0A370DCY3_9GAMM|nr:MAG: hypothetical protein DIZ80_09105 [endosymbiont of Galathealinum brachiosum]
MLLNRYLTIILFSCLLLTACTNAFFQPLKQHLASPEQYEIEYEDIYFKGDSGLSLHGWWFPASGDHKATILFLHGNGENISTHSGLVFWLTQHQYDVFIFDYRGYGKSEGKTEIEGVMSDIQSAREYVVSRKKADKKLFIIGHSLGASLGIYNIAKNPDGIDAMVLVSPFNDYRQIARETLDKSWLTWAFQWPASLTIDSQYNPIDYVGLLPDKPKLFLYSVDDRMIAADHVIQLYENARGEKHKEEVTGDHNSLFAQKENQQIILHYLNQWSK